MNPLDGDTMPEANLVAWDFAGGDGSCSSPTHSTQMMMIIARPQGTVTPDHSFGEREQISASQSSSRPLNLPAFLPFGSHHSRSDARVSVGLPSEYPTHNRNSSLASSLLEELQDFDEFFGSPASLERTHCIEQDEVSNMFSKATIDQGRGSLRGTGKPRHRRRSRNHAMGTKDFYNKVLKDL